MMHIIWNVRCMSRHYTVMHKQHSIATMNTLLSAHITTGEYITCYNTSLFQKVILLCIANVLLDVR